jgi:1-acyl-sn-glycerol-3-phosphate acyltransferase
MRVRVAGVPPRRPFFLVCNHLGYVDILALASCLPSVFVAKAELARWPVLGHLARAMNTVFVDRTRATDLLRVLGAMDEVVATGGGMTFFPEGTSSSGEKVLPFRSSLFEAPARRRSPVFCVGLRYQTRPSEPDPAEAVCWWGDMTFVPHLWKLLQLEGFDGWLQFGGPVQESDRKALARVSRDEVARLWASTQEHSRR